MKKQPPLSHVFQVSCKSKNGHYFTCNCDVELALRNEKELLNDSEGFVGTSIYSDFLQGTMKEYPSRK